MENKICGFCKKEYQLKGKRNHQRSRFCSLTCSSNRFKLGFNHFEIKGKITEIYVKNKIVLIDTEDLSKVNNEHWHLSKVGYASFKNSKAWGNLHSFILPPVKGLILDHINQNKLDNRKCNLRNTTHRENMRNSKRPTTSTSGHKGVSLEKKSKKWIAQIMLDDKCYNLGRFKNIQDAIHARKIGELKYWGKNY